MSVDHFTCKIHFAGLLIAHKSRESKSFSEANLVDDSAVVLKADAVVVQGMSLGSNYFMSLFSLIVSLPHRALISQGGGGGGNSLQSLTSFELETATPNTLQNGGQTHATCCTQKCCVGMLRSFSRGFRCDDKFLEGPY